MTLKELKKIYEANKKIEVRGNITGHVAKKLLNNCKRALVIISTEIDCEAENGLREEIKVLEDQLASRDKISSIDYNLGARSYIHVPIQLWDTLRNNAIITGKVKDAT